MYHWMLVGGEEKRRMVQVRLMVLPGFTNTEDSAWMTAVAARERERLGEIKRDKNLRRMLSQKPRFILGSVLT